MDRRRVIVLVLSTGALAASPLARAQPKRPKKVGLLMPVSADPHYWDALKRRLGELGHAEGRDIVYEARSADGKFDRLPSLAKELVGAGADLIVTASTPGARAAKGATATMPIVIATADDPVASGMAASLARPGGNVTGVSNMSGDVSPKMLELASITLPGIARIAVLGNPDNPQYYQRGRDSLRAAAGKLGIAVLDLQARTPQEIEAAFATIARERVGALIVISDPFLQSQRQAIARLALGHRIPPFVAVRDMVVAGALMSYGTDYAEHFRRAAYFVDRILKGAKPADLPFEQAATFELVVNKKTAAALGIRIPSEILLRASEVIE